MSRIEPSGQKLSRGETNVAHENAERRRYLPFGMAARPAFISRRGAGLLFAIIASLALWSGVFWISGQVAAALGVS